VQSIEGNVMVGKPAYIVSPTDGQSIGTRLYSPNGEEIPYIFGFEIDPIDPESGRITAKISMVVALGKET